MSTVEESPGRGHTPRGVARRQELLTTITDDVIAHGLADFSLRRAARACGTTHKVLIYHFETIEGLLALVVTELRSRRVAAGLAAAARAPRGDLASRVRALWPALLGPEAEALDQALGLAMSDPARYGGLFAGALDDYLPALVALCPEAWTTRRKREVAGLVLATLRGLVLARRTSPAAFDPDPAFAALDRALRAEVARDKK